ncbi:MAG: hypothetical protein VW438_00050 [Euryarchaeota archaeon]|jgi:hypothetical protein
MIAAVVILGITTITNAALAGYMFYMGQRERDDLLTRIQAPEASRMQVVANTVDNMPAIEEAEMAVEDVQWDHDLRMILDPQEYEA